VIINDIRDEEGIAVETLAVPGSLQESSVNSRTVRPQQETINNSTPPVQLAPEAVQGKVITERQPGQYTTQDVRQAADKMNKAAQVFNTKLHFEFDDKSKELYLYVIDTTNNQVISRVPPEGILNASSRLQNMVGLFFNMLV